MDNYKEKIKKLLSLAQSDNENEAKSAFLKAQELMIKNKITERDLDSINVKKVKRIKTGLKYSSRSNSFILDLSKMLAENYCCVSYAEKEYKKQTRTVILAGFEDDVEICMDILTKAVETITINSNKLVYRKGYDNKMKKIVQDSYAKGFVSGLEKMYKEQRKKNEDEWGLILITPNEVKNILNDMNKKVLKVRSIHDNKAYEKGIQDGNNFKVTKTHGIGSSTLAICG